MTYEEALAYCADKANGVRHHPELGVLFVSIALMREDLVVAKTLGASVCLVPTTIWTDYETCPVNDCVAALIRGDIYVRAET